MKLPEPLFAIINPTIGLILKSPLHGIMSGNLMLITFTGRKSKRRFTTPVRYVEFNDVVRCFSTTEGKWWLNLRGGAEVTLRIRGEEHPYQAQLVENDTVRIKAGLEHYLALFPQDAAYHGIRLNKDKSPNAADLDQACQDSVMVEAIREK